MSNQPHFMVLHGPNLDRLGSREPDIYGHLSLEEINEALNLQAAKRGCKLEIHQSNSEGQLVEYVHRASERDGLLINPAAFTHYSLALLDALRMLTCPVVEVHLSNLYQREEYRRHSVTAEAAAGVISGFGAHSYQLGLDALINKTVPPSEGTG